MPATESRAGAASLTPPEVHRLSVYLLLRVRRRTTRTREVVRHADVSIEVITEGRGPLILLRASLGRDADEFDPVAERIAAAGFRVVRPQPRGYAAASAHARSHPARFRA